MKEALRAIIKKRIRWNFHGNKINALVRDILREFEMRPRKTKGDFK